MTTQKTCVNPECRRRFTPSKYNPGRQKTCDRAECKKYQNSKRQQKYYRTHSHEPGWSREHSIRKKRERHERGQREQDLRQKTEQTQSRPETPPTQDHSSKLLDMVYGLISYVNGITDGMEVGIILDDCMRRGMELRKKIGIFPNARSSSP